MISWRVCTGRKRAEGGNQDVLGGWVEESKKSAVPHHRGKNLMYGVTSVRGYVRVMHIYGVGWCCVLRAVAGWVCPTFEACIRA